MSAGDRQTVVVGRVRRPHGVKGEVVVQSETDVPGRFAAGSELELVAGAGRRAVRIKAVRGHGRKLLVLFDGIGDRTEAETLRGAILEVSADRERPVAGDAYYYFELMDCRCRDRRHGDLGRVVDVVEDGGGLLLEVVDGERTLLVPFVQRYLVAVDRAGGTIELDLPPGLIETCASRS